MLLIFLTFFVLSFAGHNYKQVDKELEYPCEKTQNFDNLDTLPVFHVSLDTPPAQRWENVIKATQPAIMELTKSIEAYVGPSITKILLSVADRFTGLFSAEMQEEMRGIAEYSKLSMSRIVFYNIFYEIFTVCTSIVKKDKATGKIYHARNLDFGLLMGFDPKTLSWALPPLLRKTAVQIVWESKGQKIAESVHFAGFIGVLTGVRKDAFSFSLNERFTREAGVINLLKYLFGTFKGKLPSMVAREVLLQSTSYEEAKEILSTEKLFAPVYYILGAPKDDACIITRGTTSLRVLEMGDGPDDTFLVETNYDFWKKPLFLDDRRGPAITCMKQVFTHEKFKNNVTLGLYNVLKTRPVFNQLTTYFAAMSSSDGTLISSREKCNEPCPLF